MQVIKGTKRQVTMYLHKEQLEKHFERLNASMDCFREFSESSDLEHLIEDCEKLIKAAKSAQHAIDFMNLHNIK